MQSTTVHPVSESFATLPDYTGKNRIIIDTDSAPWCDIDYNNVANASMIRLALATNFAVTEIKNDDGLIAIAMADVLDNHICEEQVTGDETVAELWRKVVYIETLINGFVRLIAIIRRFGIKRVAPYADLALFVRRHTRGYLYEKASRMFDEVRVAEIVDPATRGWKCPICCEAGANAHMCHAFPCKHTVHYACSLRMLSGECPICRTLE